MKFRQLQLRITTTGGHYGASLEFRNGLVVVWADNSMGKSTCVHSMLVALGLEAMLTVSRNELPLPPAVKSRLDSEKGELAVLESEVFLEIENSSAERIVTHRTIKGRRDHNLITVHFGPVLSVPGTRAASRDFFVNLQGSATRERGFHYFLAEFLGWSLPKVQSFDGSDRPLYLQCVFPYFVVEQTRGWSTLQPPVPTHFRLREAHKRVVEFTLNLDAHRVALKRMELLTEKASIETEWKSKLAHADDVAHLAGGTVQSLPRTPTALWPLQVFPSIVVPSGTNWIALEEKLELRRVEYARLVEQEIPRVQEIASAAESELNAAEVEAREKQSLLSRLLDALETEKGEVRRVEQRLHTIEEDIQRHKDVKTLRGLGSREGSELDDGHCPVCHQAIQDSLLPHCLEDVVMSLEENIEFLSEQRRTFEMVRQSAARVLDARTAQIHSVQQELSRVRERVRSLKQTLNSDGRLPSEAAIRARIELENSIQRDEVYVGRFRRIMESFGELAERYCRCQSELESLPREDVTIEDKEKISRWTSLLQDQLNQFGFKSLPPRQISISEDTYRPEHQGFELQAGSHDLQRTVGQLQNSISASDLIRTIWAYLNGMLELARSGGTNHPGFMVFDEPRQQSTRDVSFRELLKRASTAESADQQVIFFTSENLERLKEHLAGVPHSLVAINGRVIKRGTADAAIS